MAGGIASTSAMMSGSGMRNRVTRPQLGTGAVVAAGAS